jgi:AcrR family transcriptional regulator
VTEPAVPARGRPRSAEADRAIFDATLRLLERDGYARMSMEHVAEEAGVGKTTIYRRYRDKADLVTGALAALRRAEEPPDTGDTRADLVEMMRRFQGSKEQVQSMRITGTLFMEQERNPELLELFRDRIITPRRRQGIDVIERGIDRGDIRPEVDPALVVEMMVGSWFARQLNGRPFEGDWPSAVVDQIWPALAAR